MQSGRAEKDGGQKIFHLPVQKLNYFVDIKDCAETVKVQLFQPCRLKYNVVKTKNLSQTYSCGARRDQVLAFRVCGLKIRFIKHLINAEV